MNVKQLCQLPFAKNASLILATGGVIAGLSAVAPANAASLSYTLDEFTGTDAQVDITLDDMVAGPDTIRVTAAVNSTNTGNIGDIVGLFFNIDDNSFINSLSISPVSQAPGDPLTASNSTGFGNLFLDKSGSTTDGMTDVDNNVNLNGGGVQRDFDFAVQVGRGGLQGGNDDYQSVTFDLSSSLAGFNLAEFIGQNLGVRLQSVGAPGSSRDGSSKLEGPVPPTSVPEPSALIGLTLVGGAIKVLRRKQSN